MTQSHNSVVRDVDALSAETPTAHDRGSAKLRHAKDVARKTEAELSTLCRGLNDRIAELGIQVKRANEYHGVERALHVIGAVGLNWATDQANKLRRERMQQLDTKAATEEIGQIVLATIEELGESEAEYRDDQVLYEQKLSEVLAKQAEATPLYLAALDRREGLDTTTATLEGQLKTCGLAERPPLERAFEDRKRQHAQAKLDEATYLAVVKNAQDAIPELQKSRDAAAAGIQSLHGMRQGMLEKFADFRVVLERATTAMRARASIELYEDTDPAFNAAVTAITGNNVATAGAALEVWTERIKVAAIDPEASQALLVELLGHVTDASASLAETETNVSVGPRSPTLLIEDHDTKGTLDVLMATQHAHDAEMLETIAAKGPRPRKSIAEGR